jgi:hypothetical protein
MTKIRQVSRRRAIELALQGQLGFFSQLEHSHVTTQRYSVSSAGSRRARQLNHQRWMPTLKLDNV